jgi:hypothetical protein
MDHPPSLPATVKPVWVPPITPYCAFRSGDNLKILHYPNGLQTVYDWESTLPDVHGDWETCTQARGAEGCGHFRQLFLPWMMRDSFRSNPWASRLSRQDIRLFAMELDDKHDITGTLLAFERSQCPRYSALSYVCGKGNHDQEIYVNGGRFCVKPNLLAALKQLKSCMICRIRDEATPPRDRLCWVWVDAMSINQEDATEKAEQISEMHHVY